MNFEEIEKEYGVKLQEEGGIIHVAKWGREIGTIEQELAGPDDEEGYMAFVDGMDPENSALLFWYCDIEEAVVDLITCGAFLGSVVDGHVAAKGYPPSFWTQNLDGQKIIVTPLSPLVCGKWDAIDEDGKRLVIDESQVNPNEVLC